MLKDAEKIIRLRESGLSIEEICKKTDSSAWYCERILKGAGLL